MIFYRSLRVGKNGKTFNMLKFRTLKEGFSDTFANDEGYAKFGKFLRRTHLDELPQLLNWLEGDLNFFGPRPEEPRTISVLPEDIKDILLSVKPGIIDISSLTFFDEEEVLRNAEDKHLVYWTQIRPIKLMLQAFYIQNKSFLFNLAILWGVIKKVVKSFFQ